MGIITISMDDDIESNFRKFGVKHKGKKKGIRKEAVAEALKHWMYKQERTSISNKELARLEKGYNLCAKK